MRHVFMWWFWFCVVVYFCLCMWLIIWFTWKCTWCCHRVLVSHSWIVAGRFFMGFSSNTSTGNGWMVSVMDFSEGGLANCVLMVVLLSWWWLRVSFPWWWWVKIKPLPILHWAMHWIFDVNMVCCWHHRANVGWCGAGLWLLGREVMVMSGLSLVC